MTVPFVQIERTIGTIIHGENFFQEYRPVECQQELWLSVVDFSLERRHFDGVSPQVPVHHLRKGQVWDESFEEMRVWTAKFR